MHVNKYCGTVLSGGTVLTWGLLWRHQLDHYTYTVLALAIEWMRELVSASLLLSKILTWHVRDRRRPDGRRWHHGQADDTDAYDIADKQTTQTAARGIVQGHETQTTSQTSRRHRRQREELVQGYESLQSEDLNDKVRGHNLYDQGGEQQRTKERTIEKQPP